MPYRADSCRSVRAVSCQQEFVAGTVASATNRHICILIRGHTPDSLDRQIVHNAVAQWAAARKNQTGSGAQAASKVNTTCTPLSGAKEAFDRKQLCTNYGMLCDKTRADAAGELRLEILYYDISYRWETRGCCSAKLESSNLSKPQTQVEQRTHGYGSSVTSSCSAFRPSPSVIVTHPSSLIIACSCTRVVIVSHITAHLVHCKVILPWVQKTSATR